MPAITAKAPGKIILLGEHAVVYGQPALAVPVFAVQAQAVVSAAPDLPRGEVRLTAAAIGLQDVSWQALPPDAPLRRTVALTAQALELSQPPAVRVWIRSDIPVAAGLGSGAAVTVALVRALSAFWGHPLPDERVNALAYEVEKLHHGTPSGIDNTVVTYARPVYFVRGRPPQPFSLGAPLTLVIADTGVPAPTAETVADVRRAAEAAPAAYQALFARIGQLVEQAREHIAQGNVAELGPLLNANHALLQQMGVSCPALERLVQAARAAGALGAKLSGGGRGGNMIALAPPQAPQAAAAIASALQRAGAARVLVTTVQ